MNTDQFLEQVETSIAKYDLLCHPFYKAWAAGELTRDDLREYARHYYHHVEAFPCYLAEFALRLDEGDLRRAVLANMCDEKGVAGASGKNSVPHSELWLDFAEGMGSRRDMRWHLPVAEVRELMRHFHRVASEGTPEEALAAFYVYESQVPRVAKEKERGLREMYGADDKTCGYFALHTTADVLPLEGLAQATGETSGGESGGGASCAGCGGEHSPNAVAGAGWNRSRAAGARSYESDGCLAHNGQSKSQSARAVRPERRSSSSTR